MTRPQPNVVKFISFSLQGNQCPELIMEYAPFGSIYKMAFSDYQGRQILQQTLQALKYLHDEKGITHRDIKPQNILLFSNDPLHIKVADFGVCSNASTLESIRGTGVFLAPEVACRLLYTNKVDIWSLGILAMSLWVGLPFMRGSDRSLPIIMNHLSGVTNANIKSFLGAFLNRNPNERLSAADFLRQPGRKCRYALFPCGYMLNSTTLEEDDDDDGGGRHEDEMPATEVWNPEQSPSPSPSPLPPPQVVHHIEDFDIPSGNPMDAKKWVPGQAYDSQRSVTPSIEGVQEQVSAAPSSRLMQFLSWNGHDVAYCPAEGIINFTHILKAAGLPIGYLQRKHAIELAQSKKVIRAPRKATGTFVVYEEARQLCELFGIYVSGLSILQG